MNDEVDDQAWLDALAGRDTFAGRATVGERTEGARTATLNEARALRAALLARAPIDELSLQREIDRDGETRAAQLLARARRDEILAPAPGAREAPELGRDADRPRGRCEAAIDIVLGDVLRDRPHG